MSCRRLRRIRRVPTHFKLLRILLPAAGRVLLNCLAVFFAGTAGAVDSSLYNLENGLSGLICDISRSVVTVEASRSAPGDLLKGAADEAVHRLISSGTIIDGAGHIVVAAATIAGYDRVIIRFEDLQLPALLVGIDYHTGLALLSVGRPLGRPARLSESHGCVGQMVVAVGNAYGLRACPTLGFCAGSRPDGSLQFSATVTPGNIGGGVFDLSGRLLGVVTGSIGGGRPAETGLAAPAHQLPATVNYLLTQGDRVAGYIGITTADIEIVPGIELTPPIQPASAGARREVLVERGTIITEVVENSPAARSGLRKGDLLFSIGNRSVTSALELINLVRSSSPGSVVELGFIRNNRPYLARLVVGKRELTTAGDFSAGQPAADGPPPSRDSLYREVDRLKRTLRALEHQIRSLGP